MYILERNITNEAPANSIIPNENSLKNEIVQMVDAIIQILQRQCAYGMRNPPVFMNRQ